MQENEEGLNSVRGKNCECQMDKQTKKGTYTSAMFVNRSFETSVKDLYSQGGKNQ